MSFETISLEDYKHLVNNEKNIRFNKKFYDT